MTESISHGITLRWDANTEADLAGYKVHYGTSPLQYESTINVGNFTEYKLAGLREGMNYLVVNAYDTSYNDSEFSAEIYYWAGDGIRADEDNCPWTPNGPLLGTCAMTTGYIVKGTGVICTNAVVDCNPGEDCQMNQEDCNSNGAGDACECYADINKDGEINIKDIMIMMDEFLKDDCFTNPPCDADINKDGKVNIKDIMIMMDEYLKEDCSLASP